MGFTLPEELPADLTGLGALHAEAIAAFEELREIVQSGEDLSDDQLAELRQVAADIDAIDAAIASAEQVEAERRDEVDALINRVAGDPESEEDEGQGEDGESAAETEVEPDAEAAAEVDAEAEAAAAEAASVAASAKRQRHQFSPKRTPKVTADKPEVGFRMDPNAPGFKSGLVGFAELAAGVESVRPGSRAFRSNAPSRAGFAAQTLGRLERDIELVEDSHALVAAIEKATKETALPGGSLTAAGGWCAPSETLYDFCEVPTAQDLLSLPEITIRRGGVRWPVEPDLTAIFNSFQFFFTEPQLEAVDAQGNPTAVKNCVEIPCPDDFEELRLNAVGYCVNAGILQHQGWPELTEWFMRSLTQEHFRALSKRSILDMANGSTALTIPANTQIAAGASVLNSIELMAVNLRLDKGLARNATIEGVAPSWLHAVIRADLAMQEGMDVKAVTDAQITSWFTARGIAFQFVADWQSRAADKPGNINTLKYPSTVDVLLYPAGTWFRSLSNVIELGVMYPKEQLQVNRYTRFFTEDAIAIGKRCNKSLKVTIPILPSGAIGARQYVAGNTPTP